MEEGKEIKILKIEDLTHDVRRYRCEKPENYQFTPGQATEVSLKKEGWKEEKRPFTFTSLPEDDHLEFTIKSYPDHDGATEQIGKAEEGDAFLIGEAWGAIEYKGPGLFLAGGAGITPFISIIRMLEAKGENDRNALVFSNKTAKDLIMHDYWREVFGQNYLSTLTAEKKQGHEHHRITKNWLAENVSNLQQYFYICGPNQMVFDLHDALCELGVADPKIVNEDLQ